MSCLALSLQPANGPDILLQTREWFPPARALVALSAFRQTRQAFAAGKHQSAEDGDSSLGDDPLAASSGQLIVGVESRYRVVYRLVNGIYVLGITTVDYDLGVNNVFECIGIVNQAVTVVVAACRGVDVTPDKLNRKYAEIYMALDIVLRGVSSIRLAAMLASMHSDSIAKMVHSAIDTESKIRGAENWSNVEINSVEHLASVDAFSNTRFELPADVLAAGDEVVASIVPVQSVAEQQDQPEKKAEEEVEKDPFAASDALTKPESLVGDFKKNKDQAAVSDLTVALAGLEVTTLPPAAATDSTHIGVEGFEGNYGGIEFGNEEASLGETFEGFNDAFGGGLDASEFVGPKKVPKSQGLGGLELLQTGSDATTAATTAPAASGAATPLEDLLVKKSEMKGPEMYIGEVISVEFRESLLARVGLMGVVYLKTLPPKTSDKETEFSFRIDGTSGVKRFVMQSSRVSSLGNGMFHVRTAPSEEPIPILKYSLLPRLTPLPLRVRLIKRHSGTLLSVMIQDSQKGAPGRLRVRMPVDSNEEDGGEEIEVVGYVKFSAQGMRSLSGVSLRPASEGKTDFYEVNHSGSPVQQLCTSVFLRLVSEKVCKCTLVGKFSEGHTL
ncbi:hypothetical protein CK203_106182 [Vitis vinifera]|uniref:MHD domain-containing protein n=1 Tax=Vitis vinifera TaxID=29760 RepID=A0A438CXS1_VITVI|nr:hypothetical protein CK203_106182 [Vitis vinifera]